jgi:hypothetical protein
LFIAKCIRHELRSFYENPQVLTDLLCAMSFVGATLKMEGDWGALK